MGKFTLLIGANDSGKTTLLEALSIFPFPWPGYPLPIVGMGRMEIITSLHGNFPRSLVYRYSGEGIVRSMLEGKSLGLKISDRGDANLLVEGTTVLPGEAIRLLREKGLALTDEELLRYTVYIPNSDKFLSQVASKLTEKWYDVEKTDAHVSVVKNFISEVVDDRFTEAVVRFNEVYLRKELPGTTYYVRLADLGDGIERFLIATLLLEAIKPKVVL